MEKIKNDYKIWLIDQLNHLKTIKNIEKMNVYNLEKIFEAIGCNKPQSVHNERLEFINKLKKLNHQL